MMPNTQKTIKSLCIYGALFAILLSPILHFLYGWSGDNLFVGLCAPINESPWEHMKLVFTPLVIFAFIEYVILNGKVKNYCFVLLKEICTAIIFILLVFYTYTSIIGHSILAIDISSYIIAIILAKYFGYQLLTGQFEQYEFNGINILSIFLLTTLAVFFIYATFYPPHINLFLDPVSHTYGIYKIH